jgi:hypothetical protein
MHTVDKMENRERTKRVRDLVPKPCLLLISEQDGVRKPTYLDDPNVFEWENQDVSSTSSRPSAPKLLSSAAAIASRKNEAALNSAQSGSAPTSRSTVQPVVPSNPKPTLPSGPPRSSKSTLSSVLLAHSAANDVATFGDYQSSPDHDSDEPDSEDDIEMLDTELDYEDKVDLNDFDLVYSDTDADEDGPVRADYSDSDSDSGASGSCCSSEYSGDDQSGDDTWARTVANKLERWGVGSKDWSKRTDLDTWLRSKDDVKGEQYLADLTARVETSSVSLEQLEKELPPEHVTRFYWALKPALERCRGKTVTAIIGHCPQYDAAYSSDPKTVSCLTLSVESLANDSSNLPRLPPH